tara:strand:- start:10131 stop:13538 length:3408 start_codon:yes stop_codon:yes gene_type:complete
MSSRKFRFVSPGIFLKEIDNSQIPAERLGQGPVIIGRTLRGPAFRPTQVANLEQFTNIFGEASPGTADDGWRDGTDLFSDSYATYAAKCYLTAGRGTDSPVTMIRLLGITGQGADGTGNSEPGWMAQNAYGLFVLKNKDGAADTTAVTASLSAIYYGAVSTFEPKINGTRIVAVGQAAASGEVYNYPANSKLEIQLNNSNGPRVKSSSYLHENIRDAFNTNPALTNDQISQPSAASLQDAYWLGESWQSPYDKMVATLGADAKSAIILKLNSGAGGMSDFKSSKHEASAAHTGWFVGQSKQPNNQFDLEKHQRLFRLKALSEGLQASKELMISIESLKVPRTGEEGQYATFTVIVHLITSTGLEEVERFESCDLDASSPNFIAKKIGDQYVKWDIIQNRNKRLGRNRNRSAYIRVEMNEDVTRYGPEDGKATVPVGYLGPVVPADITGTIAASPPVAASVTLTATDANAVPSAAGAWAGEKITLTDHENTTVTFVLVDDDHDRKGGGGADGNDPLIAGGVIAENNIIGGGGGVKVEIAGGDSRIGGVVVLVTQGDSATQGEILDHLRTRINAHPIKLTAAARTGNTMKISSDSAGTAGNGKAVSEDIANIAPSNATLQGGSSDASVDVAINSWVADTMDLTNFSLHGTEFRIKWPDLPLINKSTINDQFKLGYSPYKLDYAADGKSSHTKVISQDHIDFVRVASYQDSGAILEAQKSGVIDANGKTKYSYKFSLEDVILTEIAGKAVTDITRSRQNLAADGVEYQPGSKLAGTSYSATQGEGKLNILFGCVKGYYVPLVGGNDGVDITESDPFNNRVLEAAPDVSTNYAYASVERAIDLTKDPELIEHNLAVMPGITEPTLTSKLIDSCEARADSLAIIDLPNIWIPPSQRYYSDEALRIGTNPRLAADDLTVRRINSSYAATYYPWVVLKDDSGRDVPVPPSVAALGVMANTERVSEVWFAPAGFNRAGLKSGAAGMEITDATERLLSSDRDTLYESNINPIASFVGADGIVIFGQKTLQSTRSALDRINVRRLLIFIKKEISRISKQVLFQPNVQSTWSDFLSKVTPFLNEVKVKFGLTDFKVVLDSSTTTDDLVDRNILYAKVFIKPARAIEFIAVDFIITRSGSSFVDPLE